MPEGDTVRRTAVQLHQAFADHPLTVSDLRWPGLSTLDFRGCVTTEVVSRGKHLLHRLDSGWTIHSHLRMEGSWRLTRTGSPGGFGDAVRAVLATATWTAAGVRLGMLDVVRTAAEHELVGHLGPDLLSDDWNETEAVARVRASDTTIGAALLDQTNLAGLGTVWASESLFAASVNPTDVASAVGVPRVTEVVRRARRLLTANLESAFQTSTGVRRHGREFYVYGRSREPCRRCGTPIASVTVGPPTRERTLYACPSCQPPTA